MFDVGYGPGSRFISQELQCPTHRPAACAGCREQACKVKIQKCAPGDTGSCDICCQLGRSALPSLLGDDSLTCCMALEHKPYPQADKEQLISWPLTPNPLMLVAAHELP